MEKVPLSPMKNKASEAQVAMEPASTWRLRLSDFRMPEWPQGQPLVTRVLKRGLGKQRNIAKYYKKQKSLLKGFTEMENIHKLGYLYETPKDELMEWAKSERMAINISNFVSLLVFVSKVLASIESRSMAVIASTLDSLLDLLSGLILWFTSYAMKKPNKYHYSIGKMRRQPVGLIAFILGFKVLIEFVRQLVTKEHIGLVAALLAARYHYWMDLVGAMLIALYTITTWAKTVLENVRTIRGKMAPAEYLTKLTYLIWNHHEAIRYIDTVRAYTFRTNYFVEVDIVLPGDMPLNQAHDIGETLQEKLEQLSEVERAFVHLDFDFTHRPEHMGIV